MLYFLKIKSSTSNFRNYHFNVRNAGNFIVLYWPAVLSVKLLQMIKKTQAVVFLMYFHKSVYCYVCYMLNYFQSLLFTFTEPFLMIFWLIQVFDPLWFSFATPTESKTCFSFPFCFFVFTRWEFALELWKLRLQCEKHPIFSSFAVCSLSENKDSVE